MARVPVQQGRTVLPDVGSPVYQSSQAATIDAFGGNGSGLVNAGRQIQGAADQIFNVGLQMKQEDNSRKAKELDIAFADRIRQIQYGSDDGASPGFKSLRGQDAVNGYEASVEAIDKARQELLEATDSPSVRQMFSTSAGVRVNAAKTSMSAYRVEQSAVANIAASEGRIFTAQSDGAISWDDPAAMSMQEKVILSEVANIADMQGLPPEAADALLAKQVSSMYASAVENAFRKDPVEAQIFYARNQDKILGTTQTKIDNLLKEGVTKVRSQELADEYTSRFATESEARQAAKEDLSGDLEDKTLTRISSFFQVKDRELGRINSRAAQAAAEENRLSARRKREAGLKAPALARGIMEFAESEDDAIIRAEELIKNNPEFLTEVNRQITNNYQRLRRAEKDAERDARKEAFKFIQEGGSVLEFQKQNQDAYSLISGSEGGVVDLQVAERNRAAGQLYATVSDAGVLDDIKSLPTPELAKVDPVGLRTKLAEEDWATADKLIRGAQRRVEADTQSNVAYNSVPSIISQVEPKRRKNGVDKVILTQDQRQSVTNDLNVFIDEFRETNTKSPSRKEILEEASRLVLRVSTDTNILPFIGDEEFIGADVERMTQEQRDVAVVEYDNIPEDYLASLRQWATDYNIEFTEDWASEVMGAVAMQDRNRIRRLLGRPE